MKLNQDLCYVLGALRDGCLTSQNTVKFKQKNKAWLSNVIIPKLNSVFGTSLAETQIYEQNDVTTRYYLAFKNKRVHAALKELLEASEGTLPKVFETMTEEQKKFFIQGFWDAEGGCPRKPSNDKKFT